MITEEQIHLIIQKLTDEKKSVRELSKSGYYEPWFADGYAQGILDAISELKRLL